MLSAEKFYALHTLNEVVGEGSYGEIYSVLENENILIKKQKISQCAIIELSMLSQLQHPNIIKIEHACIDKNYILFSMRKGKLLREAFLDGEIELDDLIDSFISVLSFMAHHGIAHRDLKENNCIVIDGQLKLIDFGMAEFCVYYTDGETEEYKFSEGAYNDEFKDPEYNFGGLNSIKCEMYAVSVILSYLFMSDEDIKMQDEVWRSYYYDFSVKNIPNSFKEKCLELQRELGSRKNAQALKTSDAGIFLYPPSVELIDLDLDYIPPRVYFFSQYLLSQLQGYKIAKESLYNLSLLLLREKNYGKIMDFEKIFTLLEGKLFTRTIWDFLTSGNELFTAYIFKSPIISDAEIVSKKKWLKTSEEIPHHITSEIIIKPNLIKAPRQNFENFIRLIKIFMDKQLPPKSSEDYYLYKFEVFNRLVSLMFKNKNSLYLLPSEIKVYLQEMLEENKFFSKSSILYDRLSL